MEDFPNAEANYKALEKLMLEPENKKCADCTGTSDDGYLCLDYGTFICFQCTEIHRGMKHRVKKISPNNIRDEDLEVMRSYGNKRSYDKWLVRYTGDHPEPAGNSKDRAYRSEYLKLKYEDNKWARSDAAKINIDDAISPRNRSTSSPPAFAAPINPFGSGYLPNDLHIIHQQQLQHQILANQQHLQQQHLQQQLLQQQLHQNQAILQQQFLHQHQQQQFLQQQQFQAPAAPIVQPLQPQQQILQQQQGVLPPQQQQHSPPKNPLTQSLTQAPVDSRPFRSPSQSALSNSAPTSYSYSSPSPVVIPPVLSPRVVSPSPTGSSSPVIVSSPTTSANAAAIGRQRSNSKIGVCPQCGAGVDSREMGKHKLKECPYRPTASAQ